LPLTPLPNQPIRYRLPATQRLIIGKAGVCGGENYFGIHNPILAHHSELAPIHRRLSRNLVSRLLRKEQRPFDTVTKWDEGYKPRPKAARFASFQ
jgi:hypothetical protein